jgi:glycerate 2-kinase
MDLEQIYLQTLAACAPDRLVARVLEPGLPRDVVAIGKCAGALLDGLRDVGDAFVAVPRGYPEPSRRAEIHRGGHPQITRDSIEAGRALIDFVGAHENILFLISGGGSACVELPLAPWFDESDVIETNKRLIASGADIGEINCVRKHLSAIKGGRLAERVRGSSVTLVYSDVSSGALADVASGPTLADPTTKEQAIAILERLGMSTDKLREAPETPKRIERSRVKLVADNDTLTETAASMIPNAVRCEHQIESDVQDAVADLFDRVMHLKRGEVLVAGGEPTVVTRGDGKGGRCSELAVRFAMLATEPVDALFASSDGIDGSTGVAGFRVTVPVKFDRAAAQRELERSNSFAVASVIGKTLRTAATGNNLRDLYLLARS